MKNIALSLVLVAGLSLAACSKPAEEATTSETTDAAMPAEDTMATGDAAADANAATMTDSTANTMDSTMNTATDATMNAAGAASGNMADSK